MEDANNVQDNAEGGDYDNIRLPLGRAVEQYLYNLPILASVRLRCQSRKEVNEAVAAGLITVERVEGALDHLEWITKAGSAKSTNRLDDIIKLTEFGKEQAEAVKRKDRRDRTVWRWVHFCPGEGSCRRECGGIGECLPTCAEEKKAILSMHHCSLRVTTNVKLSDLLTDNPVNIKIQGSHAPVTTPVAGALLTSRLALSRETRDQITVARRANRQTARGVKRVMLAKLNGAQRDVLQPALENVHYQAKEYSLQRYLERDDCRLSDGSGPWTVVKGLVAGILKEKGHVLYYQEANITLPEGDPDRYYVLVTSDDI